MLCCAGNSLGMSCDCLGESGALNEDDLSGAASSIRAEEDEVGREESRALVQQIRA